MKLSFKSIPKADYLACLVLEIIIGCFILGFMLYAFLRGNMYIFIGDPNLQHIPLADLFRDWFYQNHQLIPQFIPNLGGGQNAFNLAYYGLGNPIIILSYLFPFIPMSYFWLGILLIFVLVSVGLFYFLLRQDFKTIPSLVASLCFGFSQSLIFQAHDQYMMMDYFPFLILSLFGVRRLLINNKWFLLIINVALIALTSFYFVPSCFLVICFYSLFIWLKINFNEPKIKQFILDFGKVFLFLLFGLGLSSFVIIPTLFANLQNIRQAATNINLWSLFIPTLTGFDGYYSIGLGAGCVVLFIFLLFLNDKIYLIMGLLLLLLLLPIFNLCLNGGLYINYKTNLPFLPLAGLLIAYSFAALTKAIWQQRFFTYKKIMALTFALIIIGSVAIPSFFLNTPTNSDFSYTPFKQVNRSFGTNINDIVSNATKYDDSIFRSNFMYNNEIENAYGDIFYNRTFGLNYFSNSIYSSTVNKSYINYQRNQLWGSSNDFANFCISPPKNSFESILQGNKYIFSLNAEKLPYNMVGYVKKQTNIWQNDKVFSLGFASQKVYSSIKQMNDLLAAQSLISGISKDDDLDSQFLPDIQSLEKIDLSNMFDKVAKNRQNFNVAKSHRFTYKLPTKLQNKLIFIKVFTSDNSQYNMPIGINGIVNTHMVSNKYDGYYNNENQIFKYIISPNNAGKLSDLYIYLHAGKYGIKNIEAFTMPVDNLLKAYKNFDQMSITSFDTNGLRGNINISKPNSVVAFSIAYDNGFNLKIDGKDTPIFKVNGGIIGANIQTGQHHIELLYQAPGYLVGCTVSLLTLVIIILVFCRQRQMRKQKLLW
ncbi:MAG: YfhO family protein [Bifidobacteriaceae bacterium]|jgi:uncharacterized membrane protein YfhO|nr:YfhO family protein [Bifidobacteriaceae bacterium]